VVWHCYLACARERPLDGEGTLGLALQLVSTPPEMMHKAGLLWAQNAICAGWADKGGACRSINVLLQRFCRPDPSSGYWALKPIYRNRSGYGIR